jgi:hypothetical protein
MRLRQIISVKRKVEQHAGGWHRRLATRAAGSDVTIKDGSEHDNQRLDLAQEECVANISIVEDRSECTLVFEGELISPSIVEFRNACERARADPKHRELVVQNKKPDHYQPGGRKPASGFDERRCQVPVLWCVHQTGSQTTFPQSTRDIQEALENVSRTTQCFS